ncbi:hypothetical protein AVEN_48578-1 [Araneus ventricosus]|uniref:Uncharacterized protein n=1 Tax=Araneus ventricosus TaxID=182803 RepID=A0A4Y2HF07_ARAVE|nr:hypothetical protein AVEN_48578-1 [Araneus ventricosus]
MTRTTPELALPSPRSRSTLTGWRLTATCDLARSRPHTVESGFEPGILQPRSQGLSTRYFIYLCRHSFTFKVATLQLNTTFPVFISGVTRVSSAMTLFFRPPHQIYLKKYQIRSYILLSLSSKPGLSIRPLYPSHYATAQEDTCIEGENK